MHWRHLQLCSTTGVNKHCIRVNMLGSKAAPLSFTLIPAQSESEPVHTEAYHAMWRALRALTAVKTCDSCECCPCITYLLSYPIVKCALCSPHYVTKHELPISHGLSDNSWAFLSPMSSGRSSHPCASHPSQDLGLGVHSRARVAVPCVVTRGRMKGRSLLGAMIGYSRQRVIPCRRLQPSWRQWIQKMMFSQHLVAQSRC